MEEGIESVVKGDLRTGRHRPKSTIGGVAIATAVESFPISGGFTIARGTKTSAEIVVCSITRHGLTGRGECVPYPRYGETIEAVVASIAAMRPHIEAGAGRHDLTGLMPAGAARNALDCALWDLEAKRTGRSAGQLVGASPPRALTTAFTISLADSDTMAAQARSVAHYPLLKVKVGADDAIQRIRAVAHAAPASRIIVDANESWTADTLEHDLRACADLGIALVEQPLPAGQDGPLAAIARPVPVCADESVHTQEDLCGLVGLYDAINIKLDKSGGLTSALMLRDSARALGFGIMVGCMVGTSLAMAPALLLAQDADFVDLDGPLLLSRDRQPGLLYEGARVSPPEPALWG